ncbi:MAG: hypothetical protein CL946_03895 [Ectothiorhodospiraceae bacterium]|nr:hypothetical protein [Ectothiorhodospiraceae bacterium]
MEENRMKAFLIILFFTVIAGTTAQAQDPIQTLTIDQAVDIALKENRNLAAARMQVEEARGRLKQAGLYPNPDLESSFGFDTIFANDGERNFTAGINQPIPLSGRIGAQKEVANVNVNLTLSDIANSERLLVQNVRRTFIELLAIEEQLNLQETLTNLNSELRKGIEAGIKEGLASQQDLNAVAIALQQTRQEKVVLTALGKSKIYQINNLMGKPPGFKFTPLGKLDYESLKDLNDYSVGTAFSQRPDLRFAGLDIERAKADLKLAKALRYDDITAGVFYENDRLVFDSSGGQITDNDQLIGFKLTIPIPIFDRKQGLIAEARSRENRAEENFRALKLTISQEVSDALNRVTTLSELLGTYQTGILRTAEDNVKLVEDGFKQIRVQEGF